MCGVAEAVGGLGPTPPRPEVTRILHAVAQRPAHVYEVYIRTTPEELWAAIVSPEYTRRYFYGGWFGGLTDITSRHGGGSR